MQLLVPIVLYGWLPLVLVIFRDLKGHRALAMVYVTAWLFLPSAALKFQSLPDYTKVSATSLGIIGAIAIFEPRRLLGFRAHWLDALMVGYCVCPIPTAISNELGVWDGCSNMLKHMLLWGLPYFFGRLYFDTFDKVRALAKAIFIGGLVYVPFCLIEIRMSPQFYNWIYGARPKATLHAMRYGGWRPTVFLDTGVELGMWMTAASLLGFSLWYSGAVQRIWGVGTTGILAVVMATTLACKSTGSLLLLIGGIGIFLAMRWLRAPWLVLCIVLVPLIYIPIRASGVDDGSGVVSIVESLLGGTRAQSIAFRFENEDMLAARAWEVPILGWGGWGRERVLDEYGKDLTIIDGMWIAMFGKYGLVGLTLFYLTFLVVPTAVAIRFARPSWRFQDVAPVVAISILLLVYMIDCLLNAMDNALYPLCLGAITTLLITPFRQLITTNDWAEDEEDMTRANRRRLWPPSPERWKSAEPVSPSS